MLENRYNDKGQVIKQDFYSANIKTTFTFTYESAAEGYLHTVTDPQGKVTKYFIDMNRNLYAVQENVDGVDREKQKNGHENSKLTSSRWKNVPSLDLLITIS